jgi:hypothetical protein
MNDANAMARRRPANGTQTGQRSADGSATQSGQRSADGSPTQSGQRAANGAPDRTAGNVNAGNRDAGSRNAGNRNGGGGFANVLKAEAAAWSPDPKNPPDYFDLPGGEGPEAALVAAKWAANSPLAMIDQYIPHLRMYSGIGMDVGRQDGLAASNEQLANVLAAYDIDHVFETYEGNHVNHIADRMEQKVLPFFSKHLDFGGKD